MFHGDPYGLEAAREHLLDARLAGVGEKGLQGLHE